MSFREKFRSIFDVTLLRFFVIGVLNSLLGLAIMMTMYNLVHASYWISTATNYVITSIISYFVNGRVTFHNRHRSVKQALRFTLNIAICFFIAYGIARPLTSWIITKTHVRVQTNIAMIVGMVLFSSINYLGQRFFVFPNKKEE